MGVGAPCHGSGQEQGWERVQEEQQSWEHLGAGDGAGDGTATWRFCSYRSCPTWAVFTRRQSDSFKAHVGVLEPKGGQQEGDIPVGGIVLEILLAECGIGVWKK